ncbi:U2 snRNP-associated SURP motif-containing protein [Daktulosphaira vitifoliae]|uniref:U2 snRNP-associated SURP motif-containing protein n=1 Tax=Daktulosphaira vitifoliae TaxID=58002 RepID=UPI0021A9FC25|nr:U2 snRNP-associated SURP motif-containing protein [Daktulosphaira vitifoliae]
MSDSGHFKKYIAEQKLKAFSIGAMGKTQPSKKEINEQKKKEEEHAAAQAFEEFVATFQNEGKKSSKVWVKAGTYDAGKRQEDTREKGKLYKPQARGSSDNIDKDDLSRFMGEKKSDRSTSKKKRDGEKKKSNLELFKEELKMIQEEREERHKFKGVLQKTIEDPEIKNLIMVEPDEIKGSFDSGDPNTTNLYLGNLNPKITEAQLMEVFGKYGPLASIKIMWPRSDEEKARGRNCGFVAYMSRKDGERALKNLNGKDVMSYEMKMGWGKCVPIPPHPIYIPPALLAITLPPPPSGLPFNAQPILFNKDKKGHGRFRNDGSFFDRSQPLEKILPQTIIKVVIPTERNLLMLIHHMIEFVIREGPLFEAMIMNKELNNPTFQFLFDNVSPAHLYYRWKLFSMLQGDSPKEWRIEDFCMFKGGSIWRPPPMNPYTAGMPEELLPEEDLITRTKGTLSVSQRERFEDLIRNMTPDRLKVAEVMVFCVEHSEAVDEICDCIQESLSNINTAIHKKIARYYLISDVLHNCGLKIINATQFRRGFETRLFSIMNEAHKTFKNLDVNQAEGFKHRMMQMFHAWEEWDIYPKEFLYKCQNTFLGLSLNEIPPKSILDESNYNASSNFKPSNDEENIDGAPISDTENVENEDLDGVPLDGAALLKHAYNDATPGETDIDGVPLLDEDIDGVPLSGELSEENIKAAAFVPSRWETVDPQEAEEQAMTTSKWEMLEKENKDEFGESTRSLGHDSQDDDFNETRENADDRRAKLREIELKVMQYQDELESGKRSLKGGWNIYQQVEHYRRKLLKKVNKSPEKELKLEKDKKEKLNKRLSPDDEYRDNKKKKRSKSPSHSPAYSKWSSHSIRSESPSPPLRKKQISSPRSNKKSRASPVESPRSISKRRDREREDRHSHRHKRSYSRSPHRHRARTPPSPLSHSSRKHKHKY